MMNPSIREIACELEYFRLERRLRAPKPSFWLGAARRILSAIL